ncbi:hypothetical protein F7725_011268 [Dissostichus mawsoni]|uniref:Mannose receptor, C type 1b n=1 Tax=Dissostichus mawsoni TaxID=36200 RepID=A0A7J5ZBM1_DISMA|nr:hypothetical protein F7725_011268 [Dissostichus mawsoni]
MKWAFNLTKYLTLCYSIINTRKETFNGAETQCRAMGGQLASILSRKAQVFLTTQLAEAPTDLWIGLHMLGLSSFLWTDGRPMRYTNWELEVTEKLWCFVFQSYVGIGKWIKKSCNDTNGYVCLRNVDPSLPDSPEPMPTDYVKILNDSMKVVTQNMSWDAAKQHCERDGAKLASLRNEWSQAYVELMALKLNASLWIGMNKNQVMFLCIQINNIHKNVPPTESSDFPGFCPDDPETQMYTRQRNSWLQFRGFCYLFLTGRIQWPDASAGCVRHGGTLASITDPSEQEFIHSNIISFQDQSSFWIGLYKTHRGMWQWLDRSVVDYSNWRMDQPGDHTYGAIRVGMVDGQQGTSCMTEDIFAKLPRKSGRSLLIPTKLSTFDNPLFFNNEWSKPDVVEIAEEENPGLVITLQQMIVTLLIKVLFIFELFSVNDRQTVVQIFFWFLIHHFNSLTRTLGFVWLKQITTAMMYAGQMGTDFWFNCQISKSVGSEISLHECDENSDLQKWECKNGTLLALKGQEFYIELTADNTAVLSKTVGPNNHLTISGTSSELFAINGNAAGLPCMFPFKYKDKWYSNCITLDSPGRHPWCAVETKYQSERWGFCPVTTKGDWNTHPTTGEYYQLNSQSALTWPQAEASCKQQGASLLSIYDLHQQAYVTALLGTRGNKLWTGLFLDPEHGWKWSNGRPYRYMNWDSVLMAKFTLQQELGYICYSKAAEALPTKAAETGFCSAPWIPYNGHCFNLNRTQKTWPDAQRDCRFEGGDLATIRNVEDQTSTDELWIGLNDRKTEGQFDWIDHSTVSFTSWNSEWETGLTVCVRRNMAPFGWRKHGSYCYFIGIQTKTLDEAKDDCRRSNSYLADVSNAVDNAFLVSLVGLRPEKYFWLGLSNQNDIDQFVWTNANSVRFTHWNAEMPGHQQGCVAMTTGVFAGLWDVLPCTNKEKYICKHLAEGAVLTPAPPNVFTGKL